MNKDSQNCPKCNSPYGYKDANLWVCPECFYEWSFENLESNQPPVEETNFQDSNGTQLQNGDTIITIMDLKAGKNTIKAGTKVKNIKLLDKPVNDHDISCKIPGHGPMYLKCSVVKKVQ